MRYMDCIGWGCGKISNGVFFRYTRLEVGAKIGPPGKLSQ